MSFKKLHADVISCTRCPRLVTYRAEVARIKRRAYADWDYWGKPIPGFGDPAARLWIVGLAPGAHGAIEPDESSPAIAAATSCTLPCIAPAMQINQRALIETTG